MEYAWCWETAHGPGDVNWNVVDLSSHTVGENRFSYSQILSIGNGFLIRTRTLGQLLVYYGILSGLNSYRSRACCHSLCEFPYVGMDA